MGVSHGPNFRKRLIQSKMSRQVGGRFQIAFDDLARQIGDYQMLRFHLVVGNSAGLDHHKFLFP